MKTVKKDRRIKNGQKTVTKVLSVARQLFGKHGYAKTSTNDIVKKAGIGRGGLYHHFPTKKDIFSAVFRIAMEEIADRMRFDFEVSDHKTSFMESTVAFLNACLDPKRLRIVMIDGPSVLGMDEFRVFDRELLTSQLIEYFNYLKTENIIKPINVETMSHLLAGATNEAVFYIAQSEDKVKSISEMEESLKILIDSIWEN